MAPKKFSALLLGGLPWKRTPVPQEALPFGEGTVLERTLSTYREAGAQTIALAMGPREPGLDALIEPHLQQVRLVDVADAASGITAFVAQGLQALEDRGHVIAIGFADMPLLSADLLKNIFEAFRGSGKSMGVPMCQGILGHPFFLLPALKAELQQLNAPATHRDLILARPDDVEVIPTDFTAVLRTIDELPDYQEMLAVAGIPLPDIKAYWASVQGTTEEEAQPAAEQESPQPAQE